MVVKVSITHRPNPSKPRRAPRAHPPFGKMIAKAIAELKERKGSSKIAILKYVSKNFNVGENIIKINSNIRQALLKGVANKTFVQTIGTGASGRFRLNEKPAAAKKPATKKPAAAKKPAATEEKAKKPAAKKAATGEKAKKPAAAKPKKAATGEKKAKTPKKTGDKVKKVKSPTKSTKPSVKKIAKSPAKKAAPKKAAKPAAKKAAAAPKA